MPAPFSSSDLAAEVVRRGFERWLEGFAEVTRRAQRVFEARDWPAGQRDATERLGCYPRALGEVVVELRELLGAEVHDAGVWRGMKARFADAIAERADFELAETFFNSVSRRLLGTVGVAPEIEFVDLDLRRARYPGSTVHKSHARAGGLAELLAAVLQGSPLDLPFAALERDARLAADQVEAEWERRGHAAPVESVELLEPVFFRGSGAYLVGRVRGGDAALPLVAVLLHGERGVELDAMLLTESEISIVFSYTRSHFHAETARPVDLVRFLTSLMPRKPIAELYISLGYVKHGKTELYRDLIGHQQRSLDPLVHAPGEHGMVMVVFTMRSYDYVFKVIRDEFAPPKTNTREHVKDRYELVFWRDRAGRLIEAHEFEQLSFERSRFSEELLEELSSAARKSVELTADGRVVVRHLYVERRVRPLNLVLREADEATAARAVLDYGQAIRDMAATNIFPGDMLLKNFGVTRHGRVIFYDYDELCLVTECEFRDLPRARDDQEELASEPWFYVGERDVFPEEFLHFLGLSPGQRRVFLEAHAEVLTAAFWRDLQARLRAGEVLDVFPYPPPKRLRPPVGAA